MMALLRNFVLCSAIALSGMCVAQTASTQTENKAITMVLKSQFERPGALLRVAPISIVENHAVVGWVQGANGGRALLQKLNDQWEVQVCAGDGLKDENDLVLAGVNKEQAHTLAAKVNQAEAGLPKQYLKQLSKFQGSVNMSSPAAGH